ALGRLTARDRVAADVTHHDVEPVLGEPDRHGPADPRPRPGHDRAPLAHLHPSWSILTSCPVSRSSPTACSTRTRRPTAARGAPASTRRSWKSSAPPGGGADTRQC